MTESRTDGPDGRDGPIVVLQNVSKRYGHGPSEVRALVDANLQINRGEFVVLLGPSGSGKTTLLNMVGAIDSPTSGRVLVDGQDIGNVAPAERERYRRGHVGFVFQFFNLVPTLTARENVELIAELAGGDVAARTQQTLTEVGLDGKMERFPAALSGGEQQRVAIARALAKSPSLLLCDEPTGALDLETGRVILHLLHRANREQGRTLFIVTHNSAIADMADRVLRMRSGRIVSDQRVENPITADQVQW